MPLHACPSAVPRCVEGAFLPNPARRLMLWHHHQPSLSLCLVSAADFSTTVGKSLQPPGAATSSSSSACTVRDLPGRA